MSACAAFWSFSFCASVASLEGVARRPLPLNLSFMGLSIFLSRPGYASCSECARDLRSRCWRPTRTLRDQHNASGSRFRSDGVLLLISGALSNFETYTYSWCLTPGARARTRASTRK